MEAAPLHSPSCCGQRHPTAAPTDTARTWRGTALPRQQAWKYLGQLDQLQNKFDQIKSFASAGQENASLEPKITLCTP